jgi:integrase
MRRIPWLRISELIGLKWKWIDLDRKVMLVRERNYRGHQGRLKSKRSRRDLPIPGVAERYRFLKPADAQPDDFVVQKDGQPLDERALLRCELKPVLEQLKLDFPGFGWHTFRRTHLTVFSEEGGTAFETRDHAGHTKVEALSGVMRE